jgi:hypothetical protein
MKARITQNATVEHIQNGWRLKIHKGNSLHYRNAQLDDYSNLSRNRFPHHSLTLSLSARASSTSIPGTWGFGAWNDPFGVSLGSGRNPFRLPALPNAAWFFSASKENYLSFRSDKPAQGFIAQSFRSPRFHPLLFPAALVYPLFPKSTRNILGDVIAEDSAALSQDVTQWHRYKMEWRAEGVRFQIDDNLVFESSTSPHPPLGIIIWIDNQFASFTPEGKLSFGVLQGSEGWLQIDNLEITTDPESSGSLWLG